VRVLQIEFNELSPTLLRQFMAAGQLPNFRRFYEAAEIFITDAPAEPPFLEPWIQWPTVHFGVSHHEHGFRHLGVPQSNGDFQRGHSVRAAVGQALSDAGLRVGVFGAMNVSYNGINGFYVPDPWNATAVPHPTSLAPYLHTVGTMVRDSSRTEGVAPGARLPQFGAFMLRNGLTAVTVSVILRQLFSERRNAGLRWRRASALDWIQYDVFRRLVKREDVDFATFFSNSTAHYQHYYWRNMRPDSFLTPPDAGDDPSYASAILFGYQSMDRILGRMLADYPHTILVLCTALSQQPWADATKQTYRPKNWASLLRLAGLSERDAQVQPVMAEEFVADFGTQPAAEKAAERFSRLRLDDKPLMKFTIEGNLLVGGCAIDYATSGSSRITGTDDGSEPLMFEVFKPIHTVRSGRHSSEGALWFRTGKHVIHDEPVDLEDIAPTVLSLLNVTPPEYMTGRVLL
jgi:hypothetical protein